MKMDYYDNLVRKESVHNFWSFVVSKTKLARLKGPVVDLYRKSHLIRLSNYLKKFNTVGAMNGPTYFSVVLALRQFQCSDHHQQ